ncbi:MAG: CinA family protein [Promethearchaeota archaeon]
MHIQKRLKKIIEVFADKGIRIALAESCTGGYICHEITNISGASKIFERGVVSYSNEAKMELLGVDEELIIEYGAISEPVAKQMAENIRRLSGVQIGISVTGIAGPGGGTKEKPAGLVYIGFASDSKVLVEKRIFKANRIEYKKLVLQHIIETLEKMIETFFSSMKDPMTLKQL